MLETGAAPDGASSATPEISSPAVPAAPVESGVASPEQPGVDPSLAAPAAEPVNPQAITPQTPAPASGESEAQRQRRVDRRNAQVTRENNELRERIARLEGRADASRPAVEEKPAGPQRPDPAAYPAGAFDEQYIEDLAAFKADERIQHAFSERESREQTEKRESATRAEREAGQKRFSTAQQSADAAGFFGALDLFEDLNKSGRTDLIDDITDMDHPAEIAECLAHPDNKAWTKALFAMTPRKRAAELGKLDDEIARQRKAPAPAAAPETPSSLSTPAAVPEPAPVPRGRGSSAEPSGGGYDRLFKN